jgi:hypothetical protein
MVTNFKKYYLMSDKIPLYRYDGTEPPVLFQRSHSMLITHTGNLLVDYTNDCENGEPFIGSLICDLDDEENTGILPTFFTSPGLIGTKEFYNDLLEIGINNIEVHPVIIRNPKNGSTIENYVFLNILGRIDCTKTLDGGEIAIYTNKVPEHLNLFLIEEDPSCILVTDRIYIHLKTKYKDIFFEEIQ